MISEDSETRARAEELVFRFFKYIYENHSFEQEHFTSCDEETTYSSYPAKWSEALVRTMERIASEADFKNVKSLDEPSAAIHTVLVQKGELLNNIGGQSLTVLMIDMGAGTTDLALCRYIPGEKNTEIVNTLPKCDGHILFGGREIDDALWGYRKEYIASCGFAPIIDEQPYLPQCKSWKEASISSSLNKNWPVTACGFIGSLFHNVGGESKPFPAIDRSVLETALSGYLSQFPRLINGLLENTPDVKPEDVDLVILTGGHSQWYFAEEILSGAMRKYGAANLPKIQGDSSRIVRLSRPQETVALGLVYQEMIKPTVYGNTVGNILNLGYAAAQGEWIYYIGNDSALYKIRVDGTEKMKLSDDCHDTVPTLISYDPDYDEYLVGYPTSLLVPKKPHMSVIPQNGRKNLRMKC